MDYAIKALSFSFYPTRGGGAQFKTRVIGKEYSFYGVKRTVVQIEHWPSQWHGQLEYYQVTYDDAFEEKIYTPAEVHLEDPDQE